MKRTTWSLRKRARTKKTKRRENPPHHSRKAIFGKDPNSQRTRHAHAPTASQICACTGKNAKNALFKTTSVLQPQGLFTLETQFRQNFKLRKLQNSNTQNNYYQKKGLRNRAFSRRQRSRRGRKTRNRSETPCFVAFRVCLPLRLCRQETGQHERNKNALKEEEKKCAKSLENGPTAKRPIPPSAEDNRFSAKCSPPFRTTKQVVTAY